MGAPWPLKANVSAEEVLRFIRYRNQYLIVPASNPPMPRQERSTNRQVNGNTKDWSSSVSPDTSNTKCPFTFEAKDFVVTVPRFVAAAICPKCDLSNCKPVMYTYKVLARKCKSVWLWTEKTIPVAYVWVQDK